MNSFFVWLLSFLSSPVINALLSAYKIKLQTLNTTEQHAVELAIADLNAQIEARKAAASVASTPIGSIIDALFAFPVIIYFNKVIVWDKVLGWGTTDPISGAVGTWVGMIIAFYFGGNIITSTMNIITRVFRK